MFQKFYTDTLGGRFIKSLLAQTPIPLFEAVCDGDNLVKDCYYVYKDFIIKCVTSGTLFVSSETTLYPSDQLYPSVFLFTGTGHKAAQFLVKSYVSEYSRKTHGVFRSSTNYYDTETHMYLGKYLRYLKTNKGIDLLPFYNCYSSKYFNDMYLEVSDLNKIDIVNSSTKDYKVVAIPILFGRTYKIAIDCPTKVLMRACIHDNTGVIDEIDLPDLHKTDAVPIQRTLSNSGKIFSSLSFRNPVVFRVETDNVSALMLQHNLYLVIQLPIDNTSSIVVLENYDNKTGIFCNDKYIRQPGLSALSLLRLNTRQSYAFSDRLVEYLCDNVISKDSVYSQNIEGVQNSLSKYFPEYHKSLITGKHIKGVWDKDIERLVQSIIDKKNTDIVLYDQDCNINKDIESILMPEGGSY